MIRLVDFRRSISLAIAMLFAAITLLPLTGGTATATGTGSVFINKHVCPAGVDWTHATYNQLALKCQGDRRKFGNGNGFGFTLITGGNYFLKKTGALQPHAVLWDDVPAHIFTIQEKLPAGFGTPVVFCQGNNGSTSFERMSIYSGNQIRPTLTDGGFLYCDWYNVRTA